MLNKLRINRHAPKAALYSSFLRGGLNYPSFRIIQAQKGILTLLRHLRLRSTVGNDILVTLSSIQLVSGLCTPFFEDNTTDLSFLSKHQYGWFLHLRQQLQAMNGTLWIEQQWTPSLQREHDVPIMTALSFLPLSKLDRMKANFCRLYSRVITVSDLSNEKGDMIPGGRLSGDFQLSQWPNLPRPPPAWWRVYRSAIRKAFAPNIRTPFQD